MKTKASGNPQRIAGIDPGLANLGLAVIEHHGNSSQHIDTLLIKTKSSDAQALRLMYIYQEVSNFFSTHRPNGLAIEAQFFQRHGDTGFKVGQAFGVCLLAAQMHNMPVWEYSPKQVKQSLVGTGSASKEQVIYMVKAILGLRSLSSNHVADALALALTHVSGSRLSF